MASHCVPAGLYTAGEELKGRAGGFPYHCGLAAECSDDLSPSLPLAPPRPPQPIAHCWLNCEAGAVVTFFPIRRDTVTLNPVPTTCEPQRPKSSVWSCCKVGSVKFSTTTAKQRTF